MSSSTPLTREVRATALPNILRLIYRNVRVNTDAGTLIILLGLPGLYLVFFGFGFRSLEPPGESSDAYLSYLTPGIMSFQAMIAGTVAGSMLWADRRYGMLAQLLASPFTRLEYLMGIMLTAVVLGLAGSAIMLGVAVLIIGSIPVGAAGVATMFGTITIGAIFFGSLMLFIAAFVKSNNAYNSIQILMLFVLDFASTVFYPYSDSLPLAIRALFVVNPMTYAADVVRGAYFGQLSGHNLLELGVLTAVSVIMLVLATLAYMRSDVSMD